SIRIFRCMGGSDADGARTGQGRSVLGKNVGCPLPAAATYAKAGSRYGLIAQVYARRGKPAVEVVVIAADTRDRIKFVRWAIGVFEERARHDLGARKPISHVTFVVTIVLHAQPCTVFMHHRTNDVLINQVG